MTYPITQSDRTPLITPESYEQMYQQSVNDPDVFWAEQARIFIDWDKEWDVVSNVDYSQGNIAWFEGASLNVAYNCLDRHLAERGEHCLLYTSPSPRD